MCGEVQGWVRFGDWLVDPAAGTISAGGESRHLEPKVMEVLSLLLGEPGSVISKERLLEEVWRDTYVTDDAVWRCIGELRRALGDDPRSPRYIETIPRKGYRTVAPVSPTADPRASGVAEAEPAAEQPVRPGRRGPRRRPWWAVAALLGVAATLALLWPLSPRLGTELRGRPDAEREAVSVPLNAEQYYRAGLGYYSRFDPADLARASDLFSRSILADPDFAPAHAGLADTYSQRAIREGDLRWLQAAIESAHRAIRLDPKLAVAYKALALASQVSGDLEGAEASYRRALRLDPRQNASALNLAAILRDEGRLSESLRWLRRVEPDVPEERLIYLFQLGWTIHLLDDPTRERAVAQAALDLAPDDWVGWFLLARLELVEGDLQAASEHAARCLKAAPDFPRCRVLAGLAELISGRPEEAAEMFAQAAGAGDSTAQLGLACALRRSGDTEKAAEIARSVLDPASRSRPAGWSGWAASYAGAAVYAFLGDRARSLDRLKLAIRQGYRDGRWLAIDPSFGGVRDDPRFGKLLEEVQGEVELERRKVDASNEPPRSLFSPALPLPARLR
jgi:DNA-binding winged helix-turn-helix (wHTH) protein/tetratricopeptide (TPR) repeat protein